MLVTYAVVRVLLAPLFIKDQFLIIILYLLNVKEVWHPQAVLLKPISKKHLALLRSSTFQRELLPRIVHVDLV
jgi:hypothetical protein